MRSFVFNLLGLAILIIGVAFVVFGLTAKICSAHYLGPNSTCPTTIDLSQIDIGIVFIVFSSPIFILAWGTRKRPKGTHAHISESLRKGRSDS